MDGDNVISQHDLEHMTRTLCGSQLSYVLHPPLCLSRLAMPSLNHLRAMRANTPSSLQGEYRAGRRVGLPTRPAGLRHPWGTTSCRNHVPAKLNAVVGVAWGAKRSEEELNRIVRRVLAEACPGDSGATQITFEDFHRLFESSEEEVKLQASISQWD